MDDAELSNSIRDLVEDPVYVWVIKGEVTLDGRFTTQELSDIVELLKTERKKLL